MVTLVNFKEVTNAGQFTQVFRGSSSFVCLFSQILISSLIVGYICNCKLCNLHSPTGKGVTASDEKIEGMASRSTGVVIVG